MMKIAIIGFANLYAMPYAKKYIEAIEEEKYIYDFIFWDRENIGESADNFFVFRKHIDSSINVVKKLKSFYQFKKFVKNVLKRNNYEKIIVLYSLPAILLRRYLLKHYKNKYIFAYTDYTFEKNLFYKKALARVVKNSYITTVTSYGFLRYLPENDKIIIAHNIEDLYMVDNYKKVKELPIIISYIGMLRNFNHIIKLIGIFENDNRFVLRFHGNGFCEEELRNYIKKNNIQNVFVYGKYEPLQKKQFVKDSDIINNSFAIDVFQKYAMTNRMYDAISNKKPQIITNGSYSQEIIEKYGLGFIIDYSDNCINDKLYAWYDNFDYNKFFNDCEIYYDFIIDDELILKKKLISFLEE